MATAPLHRRLARVLSWHRRKLAAGLAAIAVLAGINAAAPPDPPTVAVLVAAHSIPAGSTVVADDLRVVRRAAADLPADVLTETGAALGQLVVANRPPGAVLTNDDLLSPRQAGPGRVIVPLRISDSDLVALLRPGDIVDVVAADPQTGHGTVLARAVRVVTVPAPAADPGLLSSDSGGPGTAGVLCLVEVDRTTAVVVTGAATQRQLNVMWTS